MDERPAPGAWRGALLGAPLAFAALPLYLSLPAHYAAQHGVTLAALGALLLATRLLDAAWDPALGRWLDRSARTPLWALWGGAIALAVGFTALFSAPFQGQQAWLWAAFWLLPTAFGHSLLTLAAQTWATRQGGSEALQARLHGLREGLALAGVLCASVLLGQHNPMLAAAVLTGSLVLGVWGLGTAPRPRVSALASSASSASLAAKDRTRGSPAAPTASDPHPHAHPTPPAAAESPPTLWRTPGLKTLATAYLLNGVAGAIPGTLMLFFVQDRLQAASFTSLFLLVYFGSAVLTLPLWTRAVRRWSAARCWQAGMVLAVAGFVGAVAIPADMPLAFVAVCLLTGATLGADLTLAPVVLAGLLPAGTEHARNGEALGWAALGQKLNLALAAGLALPALGALGYQPGSRDSGALAALAWVYAGLPCAFKLAAALVLQPLARRTTVPSAATSPSSPSNASPSSPGA